MEWIQQNWELGAAIDSRSLQQPPYIPMVLAGVVTEWTRPAKIKTSGLVLMPDGMIVESSVGGMEEFTEKVLLITRTELSIVFCSCFIWPKTDSAILVRPLHQHYVIVPARWH